MRKSLQDSESVCSTLGNTNTGTSTRKRGFSLRRLLVASHIIGHRPSRTSSTKSTQNKNNTNTSATKDVVDAKSSSSSKDVERGLTVTGSQVELHQATSRSSVYTTSTKNSGDGTTTTTSGGAGGVGAITLLECPLCLAEVPSYDLAELSACNHRSCLNCLAFYLRIEISESRVCIACPECAEPMHPNEIKSILDDQVLYEKYEDFMVRRVLAVDPDTRWCPAPDCTFAVIAAGCASCPKIKCERPGCNAYFCYHCKAEWHPNQTCDAARAQRSPNVRSSSVSFSQDSQHRDDIKPCPRCQVLIVKMDDGSCNHMMCAVCGAEFCWLCMKEISDLHYLSPSGCTFWGKKPWSRKKKILWQLGTLVGAPVGIALVAGIAVPAMIIGIPVWVGRKLYTRYRLENKHKRNAAIVGGAIASVLISPVLAGLAVGIGVPILLFYVYGVVPVSLCRSGGCGVTTTGTGVKFEFDDENDLISQVGARNPDNTSIDAVSYRGANPSIGEASISMVSGSQMLRLGHEADRESASNVAIPSASLAGSIGSGSGIGIGGASAAQRLEVQADVSSQQRLSMSSETTSASASASLSVSVSLSVNVSLADDGNSSTRALAGSMLNYRDVNSNSNTNGNGSEVEDCSSERVRFDDNISFIAPYHPYEYDYEFEQSNCPEKVSIGSSCSFRNRCAPSTKCSTKSPMHTQKVTTDNDSNDSNGNTNTNDCISIDMSGATSHLTAAVVPPPPPLPIYVHVEDKPKKNMSATEMLRSMFFRTTLDQHQHQQSLPIIQEPQMILGGGNNVVVVDSSDDNTS